MIAGDFVPPPAPACGPWARYLSYVPLDGLAVPVVKLMDATGQWPRTVARSFGAARPRLPRLI